MPTPHEWLKAIGATESLRDIASRSGISHATLSRQITNGRFLIETSLELARAYDASPIAALVANGHLTEEEAGISGIDVALSTATDEQIVLEVGRRLGVSGSILFDAPISQAVEMAGNVVGHGRFPGDVGSSTQDEDSDEPSVKQPPAKRRTAARKGARKADEAPYAD
ncbi:MAG: hypothetical protein BGO45_10845 [Microbacterium sp. 71-36]|uniref:hypothetical protein n=1 Tax=unclassified Microbacterium TaxID=2609290 RepID=UPI000868524C|nr:MULTISPECIES: hypothetical protein [unclassified Microbacterium]MBN9210763.1 hypothetical protein [Microbacterium sp.]ODT40893.1 MAG: hypothetical protein ABS60_03790 [Microbacterium sp. SCN 71-17]OJV77284.1 MAG: hypothetical protein BGO45_10845 [Microbacterium sp. 71-36]